MTGPFNETTRRLLREADVNGGLDDRTLFDLIVASHEETTEFLVQNTQDHAGIIRRLDNHIKVADETFASIDRRLNESNRRSTDPEDADFGDRAALAFADGYEREQYDKGVQQKLMSKATRFVVVVTVMVLLASLAYAFLERHDDLQADLATGISSIVAAAMLIWAMMRKEK